jgi:hypothetical protein
MLTLLGHDAEEETRENLKAELWELGVDFVTDAVTVD